MRLSCVACGSACVPSMIGTFGPYTSASIKPTLCPSFASASARFTATVVFPTPPLPLATATRFFTPGIGWRSGVAASDLFLAACFASFKVLNSVSGGTPPRFSRRVLRLVHFCSTGIAPEKFRTIRQTDQTRESNIARRGTSCISSPTRTGTDRCAPLSRPRAPASALPPAPGRSDTANPAAAAACLRSNLARHSRQCCGVPIAPASRWLHPRMPRWPWPPATLRRGLRAVVPALLASARGGSPCCTWM